MSRVKKFIHVLLIILILAPLAASAPPAKKVFASDQSLADALSKADSGDKAEEIIRNAEPINETWMSWVVTEMNVADKNGNLIPPNPDNPPYYVLKTKQGNIYFDLKAWRPGTGSALGELVGQSAFEQWFFVSRSQPKLYIVYTFFDPLEGAELRWGRAGQMGGKLVDIAVENSHLGPWTQKYKPEEIAKILKLSLTDNYITTTAKGPFNEALENAMKKIIEFSTTAIGYVGGWINAILFQGNDIGDSRTNVGLTRAWTRVRNLTLSLLTLGLLIIAFANVLSIDLEKYGITRLIPKLVIAIVMTYFSYLILRFLLELASAFQVGLLGGQGLSMQNFGGINSYLVYANTADVVSRFGQTIFLIILLIGILIAMLYLCLVLIIRIVVIWFLVAVAPLAFMMQVMPFTEFLYHQWWQRWWKWVFMGPAIAFMLWLTNIMLTDAFTRSMLSATSKDPNNAESWIILLMAAAAIFIAAGLPMMMGGDIISAVAGNIKKYGQHAPGVKHAQQFWQQRKDAGVERRKLAAMKFRAGLAGKGYLGRKAAGVTSVQARKLEDAYIAQKSEEYAGMNGAEKNAAIGSLRGPSKRAMIRAMLEADDAEMKNPATFGAFAEELNKDKSYQDQKIVGKLTKDHPGIVAKVAAQSAPGSGSRELANTLLEKTKIPDMKPELIKYGREHNQELLRDVLSREGAPAAIGRSSLAAQREFAVAMQALKEEENLGRAAEFSKPREDMGKNPDGTPRNFGEQ